MKLYRLLAIVALIAAAACTATPPPNLGTATPPPATDTSVPTAAATTAATAAATIAAPTSAVTPTVAATAPATGTPTQASTPTVAATVAPATDTATTAAGTPTPELTATPQPTDTAAPTNTAPAASPVPGSIMGQHTVQPGETVFCIARGYGVLPAAIAQANGLAATMIIVPGQVLKIPAVQWVDISAGPVCPTQFASPYPGLPASSTAMPSATAAPTDTPQPTDTSAPTNTALPETPVPGAIIGQHTVQPGETVFCIGRGYGVLPEAIAETNHLGSAMTIFAGQVLQIPAVQWLNIPPGPACQRQFASPFPGGQ
jgi:type VI secretion system secreted protein VgrG